MNLEINMNDPKYVALLDVIDIRGGSMGAGKAKGALARAGIAVSEPTAGRALRDLESAGLLARDGGHGRKLTSLGSEYLNRFRQEKKNLELASAFAKNLNPREKEELVDILIARRAVEVALAELAAAHITDAQIEALREIIEESRRLLEERKDISGADTAFHTIIAAASGNRTLAAALDLIWHGGEYSRKLVGIRYHAKKKVSDEHEYIVSALSTRDPASAGRAMELHLDRILEEVEALSDDLVNDSFREPPL